MDVEGKSSFLILLKNNRGSKKKKEQNVANQPHHWVVMLWST
jgi:hypothetical protein